MSDFVSGCKCKLLLPINLAKKLKLLHENAMQVENVARYELFK